MEHNSRNNSLECFFNIYECWCILIIYWLFTCPKAGYYEVLVDVRIPIFWMGKNNSSKKWFTRFHSGQARIIYNNNYDNGDEQMVFGTTIVNCAVNDTLSLRLEDKNM